MGRAGGGGGRSGGFSGGGHHSVGHSGGGHRASFSGSSRAGSSRSGASNHIPSASSPSYHNSGPSVFNSAPRGGFTPPIIINNGGSGGLFGSRVGGFGCGGCLSGIMVLIIVIVIFGLIMSVASPTSQEPTYDANSVSVPESSYNREKLEGTSWSNDCVIDETGWIVEDGSISSLERKLRTFYDKTGVQPFVYLVGYRPELVTDSQKEQFAYDFYENEIGNSYTFVFFYFEERNPDDVGYMYYEGGTDALGVMDPEAVDIFWAICDQEWYGDGTTEECLANMFNRTADRIMTRTATKNDITKIVLIIVLVIVVAIIIIIIMNKRRKQEKERNEETRKILETPLE